MRRAISVCVIAVGALAMMGGTVGAETATYQVAASADDCFTTDSWGAYNQPILYWPYSNGDRRAFMRWAIDIPAGATVTSAVVKVKSNGEAGDANASTIRLQLVDSGNCPAFTTNPHGWAVTAAYVDWSVSGTWSAGQWYTSDDVSSLVQAFVDRGGYASGNYLGLRGINESGSWKRAYQFDNAAADAPVLEVTYSTSQAPVADAGSDQTVTDSDSNGSETVTLDGSGSTDTDGTIQSWVWTEGGSQIATGETPQVTLDVGVHTITLTVTDNDSNTDTDTVTVTVEEPSNTVTTSYQVAASVDDCFTTDSWGAYNQPILYWPYSNGDRRAFMRWAIDIPAGATVTSAVVKMKSNGEAGDANASTVRLQLVDSDNCPDFTTNPHGWAVTAAYVDSSVSDAWTAGQWYTSDDVSSLVQAFVDRGGYASGNYLGLRGINESGSWKRAYQFDNAAADAPILEVTYTTGGGGEPVEQVVEMAVEASNDDAAVTASSGAGSRTVSTMYWPYSNTDRRSFMRWASIVPPNATITEAYLKVCSNGEAGNASASELRIDLVDSDDCPVLSESNPFSWSVTGTPVNWSVPGTWTDGQWYTSPDISSLVQAFVDRPGYDFAQYIGLRAMHHGSGMWKRAYTWDEGDHSKAPVLEVHYTGGDVLVDLWMADPEVRIAQEVYCQIFNNQPSHTLRVKLDGQVIHTKVGDLQREEMFVADYRSLTAGQHTLLVEILDASDQVVATADRTWTTLHDGVPHVGIDVNNALRVDDVPFFPIDVFQWNKSKFDWACMQGTVNATYGEGYYPTHNIDSWKDYIDANVAKGWMTAGPLQWDGFDSEDPRNSDQNKLVQYVQQTKDYSPNLLAWFWDDEPSLGDDSVYNPPTTIRQWTDLCHANDTNHPHRINLLGYNFTHEDSGYQNERAQRYCFLTNSHMFDGVNTPVVDMLGFDYYPYEYSTKWSWCRLTDYLKALDRMDEWNYGLLPFSTCIESQDVHDPDGIGHEQPYGWPISHQWTPDPTPDMLHNLLWASVIHNAKAIDYFMYFSPVPAENISVMQTFKTQMTALTPVVLSSSETAHAVSSEVVGSGRVDMTAREHGGDVYVLAADIRDVVDPILYEESGEWVWNLPSGTVTARFYVEGMPSGATVSVYGESRTITAQAGYFEDTFDPLEVHIYSWTP